MNIVIIYKCKHTVIYAQYQFCSDVLLSRIQQTIFKQTEVLFFFFVTPTYTYFKSLFATGWHFKTSSKSRLSNSMVAMGCPCTVLKLFICCYLPFLDSSHLFLDGRLRPALTFSFLWISLTRGCFYLQQGCSHNCCKGVDFGWIFPKKKICSLLSFPLLPSVLSFPFSSPPWTL